ncbi:MAG TPA: hypothetical protein VJN96_09365 [Vicinamibacterales bacterium]|nr:hypothetical protein [Vicinamibacterales bacterium]
MRRLLAACLLVVFAALATADTFACPDGCQTAASPTAAEHSNATGNCVFCTGGLVTFAIAPVPTPRFVSLPSADLGTPPPPLRLPVSLDHPPRAL